MIFDFLKVVVVMALWLLPVVAIDEPSASAKKPPEASMDVLWDEPDATQLLAFRSSTQPPAGFASWRQEICEIPLKPNHVWRKTQNGWQQIPIEPPPFVHYIKLPPYRKPIHPLSIASLTLLTCLAVMAWASSEWDWNRFIEY